MWPHSLEIHTVGERTARNLRAADCRTAALPFGHPCYCSHGSLKKSALAGQDALLRVFCVSVCVCGHSYMTNKTGGYDTLTTGFFFYFNLFIFFIWKYQSHNMGSNLKFPGLSISAHLLWDIFRDGKWVKVPFAHPLCQHSDDSLPRISLTPNLLKSQAWIYIKGFEHALTTGQSFHPFNGFYICIHQILRRGVFQN